MTFDPQRWAFALIALVIVTYLVIVLGSVGMCWYYAQAIIEGKWKCDAEGKLSEALAAALAAALALTGFKR